MKSKKAKVYFISARTFRYGYKDSLAGKFENFLTQFPLNKFVGKNEVVPIKMHLGSYGSVIPIPPAYVNIVVKIVKQIPAKPFVTDSARIKAYDYLEVARRNGYDYSTLGAPVIIADGIYGLDTIEVKAGRLLKKVSLASAIYDAKSMIVLTHFKGHIQAGIGGAIKNLAMGGISGKPRDGTWEMGRGKAHFLVGSEVLWDEEKCIHCLTCVDICPVDAVSEIDGKIVIDHKKCWRCGRCISACPSGALFTEKDDALFQEALAEQAAAVVSTFPKNKILYINFLLHIQPECDCMDAMDVPIVQDIGILISDDPVAIDTASLDLVNKEKPLPNSRATDISIPSGMGYFEAIHRKKPRLHIEFAEKMGLGTMNYEIIRIGED